MILYPTKKFYFLLSIFYFLCHGFLLLILLSIFYFLFSLPAMAAEMSLDSESQTIGIGQQFEVALFLNTQNEDINAVEGEIVFPTELLELDEIRDGNSIINFWIEKPEITSDNRIVFSGIIPGGYQGKKGLIFSMIFKAKSSGLVAIEIDNALALRNDGEGTKSDIILYNLNLSIYQPEEPITEPEAMKFEDNEPPESFKPLVGRDEELFNGKYFLVFSTQDKGRGVDYYRVCEKKRECVEAESPYLLQNQNLDEEIIVKAIDKNGNERIAVVPAPKPRPWYENYSILAIIIIAIAYFVWENYGGNKKNKPR